MRQILLLVRNNASTSPVPVSIQSHSFSTKAAPFQALTDYQVNYQNSSYCISFSIDGKILENFVITPEGMVRCMTVKSLQRRLDDSYLLMAKWIMVVTQVLVQKAKDHWALDLLQNVVNFVRLWFTCDYPGSITVSEQSTFPLFKRVGIAQSNRNKFVSWFVYMSNYNFIGGDIYI